MTASRQGSRASTARVAWTLLRNEPVGYLLSAVQFLAFHASPLLVGWLLKVVLDRLGHAERGVPWMLLAAVLGVEAARWCVLVVAVVHWHGLWVGWQSVPRINALTSLVTGSGPAAGRLPGSPGEAVSRFRDDVEDLALVLDIWLDVTGVAVASAIGLAVMLTIEPVAALGVVAPVALALGASAWLGPRLRTWRRAAREATAQVTGFIGDTFAGILAVKTGAAEPAVDRRFAALNALRAKAARTDQIGTEVVRALGYGTAEITIGVVLLAVAGAFRAGRLSVGDIALFATYVTTIASIPKWVGRMGAYLRQADVAVDRLAELMPTRDRRAAAEPVTLHLRHGPQQLPALPPPPAPFHSLTVRGLTVLHAGSGRGIVGVDLVVREGELVVITGEVGAGKTTLLRGLLGLLHADAGIICWNGVAVAEPSTFLVPPRAAYLPQVPRLFSEPLAATVLLGLPPDNLEHALWLACLEDDLAAMPDGPATRIGPRGLRLSGGQAQRVAAARALVRHPQLLVVDDLSSALDVHTETQIWERFTADPSRTALLVSHRPHILDIADRIITLDRGRVVDVRPP